MSGQVLTKVQDVKIPLWVKICFASNGFARMIQSAFMTLYLVYYWTDVLAIDGKIISLVMIINKVWDIINDPMLGAMIDRTESKEGKCRFWLKYFSIPGGMLAALVFVVPDTAPALQVAWFAVFYILSSMATTANNIPANALMGRITSNKLERSKMNQINTVFSVLGSYAAMTFSRPLANLLAANNIKLGLSFVSLTYGVLYSIMFLTAYVVTKGYEPLEHLDSQNTSSGVDAPKKEKTPISETIRAIVQNKVWLLCVLLYVAYTAGESIMQSSMVQYYMYNLGNVGIVSFYSSVTTPCSLIGVFFLTFFIKRLGNSGTAALGCTLSAFGYLMRFILADAYYPAMVACWGISSFGGGLIGGTIVLCMFDSRVYGKWKTGVDNDAILMSGFTTAAKIGIAAGGPIAAFLLGLTNYVPQAATQSSDVLRLFQLENSIIPCCCLVLGIVSALIIRKYEKMLPQIQAEIDAREAAKQS